MLLVNYKTYNNLAKHLGISNSSLKSWINQTRTPTLRTLDKIADKLGCHTCDLLKNKPLPLCIRTQNNSHATLCRNLKIFFIEHQCFSIAQKLLLLENQISDYVLVSYLRSTNYKLPSLYKLDKIADALNIESYKLIA